MVTVVVLPLYQPVRLAEDMSVLDIISNGRASVVFGITQRNTSRAMLRYGLYCFAMFVGGVIVAGWVMWILRR